MAAQVLGLQAGYGYATTIDPTSQADAGVLQVVTALMSGLLFLTLGVDRQLFRVLAASFEKFPAGAWAPSAASLDGVVSLGSGMFSLGLRLALPVVALLLLLDVSLAVLGRMQQQLQLLSLAFPMKMLAALKLSRRLQSPIRPYAYFDKLGVTHSGCAVAQPRRLRCQPAASVQKNPPSNAWSAPGARGSSLPVRSSSPRFSSSPF